LQKANHEMSFF